MLTKTLIRGISVVIVAIGTAVSVTSPAHALADLEVNYANNDDGSNWYIDIDAKAESEYAYGGFDDDGDIFYVRDMEGDGMRVAIHWKLGDDSRRGLCIRTGGVMPGPRDPAGPMGACNKNLPEGRTVMLRVGRCDGDVHSCEQVSHYQNWTAFDSTSTG